MKKYHRDYLPDSGKTYQYTGDYYLLELREQEQINIFKKSLFYLIVFFLSVLIAGLLNNHGSRNIFIMLPFAFLFLPGIYLCMGVFHTLKLQSKMELAVYDQSIGRLLRSCKAIILLSAYLCAADSIFILSGGAAAGFLRETVFLLIIGWILAIICIYYKYLRSIWKRIKVIKHNENVPEN